MPRTIDKLRGRLPGGHDGGYFINGQIKGISGFLLEQLGLTEEQLTEAIAEASDEDALHAWLRANVDTSLFPKLTHVMKKLTPEHAEDPEFFRNAYAETIAVNPGLTKILDIVDADDRRVFGPH